jgi:hypothetical protein
MKALSALSKINFIILLALCFFSCAKTINLSQGEQVYIQQDYSQICPTPYTGPEYGTATQVQGQWGNLDINYFVRVDSAQSYQGAYLNCFGNPVFFDRSVDITWRDFLPWSKTASLWLYITSNNKSLIRYKVGIKVGAQLDTASGYALRDTCIVRCDTIYDAPMLYSDVVTVTPN